MYRTFASPPVRQAHRGGIFLGLIIGLLVGLAAALAVAIYVTKVPVPFANRAPNAKSPVEQDAQEALKNKNWDPNAPLYGKNPANPANPSAAGQVGSVNTTESSAGAQAPQVAPPPAVVVPSPAVKPPAQNAPTPPVAVAPQPAAKTPAPPAPKTATTPAPSADPLGDLAKAKTTAATAEAFTYFVQAGAFRTSEDAENQRAKVAMAGFEAKVTEREQSGRTVYRVRVGPLDKKDDADRAKDKLDAAGFESAIVRVQR